MSFKYTLNKVNWRNLITNCIFIKSQSQNRLRKIIKVKTWHKGQLPINYTRRYNVMAKRSGSDVKSQVKPWIQILLASSTTCYLPSLWLRVSPNPGSPAYYLISQCQRFKKGQEYSLIWGEGDHSQVCMSSTWHTVSTQHISVTIIIMTNHSY